MACYVQLSGGLGNQLFEIAAAYAHCSRTGRHLQISRRTNCKRGTYWDTYTHKYAAFQADPPRESQHIWREPHFHYAPIPAAATQLSGYFQSSKYFADVSANIRALFDPPTDVKEAVHADLLTPTMKEKGIVLHIRRGDYVALPQYHCILTPDYYRRVVTMAKERVPDGVVVVFSDDLNWCRSLEWLQGAIFVDEPSDVRALYLMSQFRHYVLSNSSFSWWGAWLGEPAALVLAPNRWFGSAGPQDCQDIYEPSWIRVPV
jgi:hypothetical protein